MEGPWLGRPEINILHYPHVWPPEEGAPLWQLEWPPPSGTWYYMGNVGGTDEKLTPVCHSTIIGILASPGQRFHNYYGEDGLEDLYLDIGRLLRQLPPR